MRGSRCANCCRRWWAPRPVVDGGRIREIYFVRNPEKLLMVHEQRDVRR